MKLHSFICLFFLAAFATAQTDYSLLLKEKADSTDGLIALRKHLIHDVVQSETPVLSPLDPSDTMCLVRALALKNADFRKYFRDEKTGLPTLSEIFSIYRVRPGSLVQPNEEACADGNCFRIEMYNYAYNLSTIATVQVATEKVLNVSVYLESQPDLPASLKELATQIAVNSKEVQAALGSTPEKKDALMAATYTALNYTHCERSHHLCVAPTFVQNGKALWCIVDLTDLSLTGIRWTNLGRDSIPTELVSERKVQNEYITNCFCLKQTKVDRNGWSFNYGLTSSDGLRISEVRFQNVPVLTSAKLVDWHVSYSNTDGFGYSDAAGCPDFSQSAVPAIEPPTMSELMKDGKAVGFVLEQKFYSEGWPRPCNYNYLQRYEFYDDGSFRVSCGNLGRGCGNDGTYRPVFRIAFAGDDNTFSEHKLGKWQPWKTEKWSRNDLNNVTASGALYRLQNTQHSGFELIPGNGQFKDGSRGDNAYIYVTKKHINKDEGESDLPTIGPCCNTDYRQGPEKFIGSSPEPIEHCSLVVWYVPQIKNDDTPGKEYCWAKATLVDGVYQTQVYPCVAGPKFVPIK